MTVHLLKLCVGATSIEDLATWQAGNRQYWRWRKDRGKPCVFHTTFQTPKRVDDLLDGGSLYWVIKGMIQARQTLVGFDDGQKENGSACCLLLLDPEIVPVKPVPRRPFQGWRYLAAENAPADMSRDAADGTGALPPALRRQLAELGLI